MNTLLGGFIKKKVALYREPIREGIPKGELIGPSKKKYISTLLALTNMPLRDQAEKVKASYNVIRTWRTEDKFWEYVDEHTKEFSQELLSHLVRRAEKQSDLWAKYRNKPIIEMAETPPPKLSLKEFADIKQYSNMLILYLVHAQNTFWKQMTTKDPPVMLKFDHDNVQRSEIEIMLNFLRDENLRLFSLFSASKTSPKELERLAEEHKLNRQERYSSLIRKLAMGDITEIEKRDIVELSWYHQDKYTEVPFDLPNKG